MGNVQEPHLDTYSNQEQSVNTETNYPARQCSQYYISMIIIEVVTNLCTRRSGL